jgi:hypothetical protein
LRRPHLKPRRFISNPTSYHSLISPKIRHSILRFLFSSISPCG